jgi:hypothetical protein
MNNYPPSYVAASDQFEQQGGNSIPVPSIRRKVNHDKRLVVPAISSSVRPSTPVQPSSGSSGGHSNTASISSQTNNPTLAPASVRDLASPAPHAEPPRPTTIPPPSASVEDPMDGQNSVIEETNPARGPTTGGKHVWIYGSNLPSGSTPLYARFGENVTRVVSVSELLQHLV